MAFGSLDFLVVKWVLLYGKVGFTSFIGWQFSDAVDICELRPESSLRQLDKASISLNLLCTPPPPQKNIFSGYLICLFETVRGIANLMSGAQPKKPTKVVPDISCAKSCTMSSAIYSASHGSKRIPALVTIGFIYFFFLEIFFLGMILAIFQAGSFIRAVAILPDGFWSMQRFSPCCGLLAVQSLWGLYQWPMGRVVWIRRVLAQAAHFIHWSCDILFIKVWQGFHPNSLFVTVPFSLF